MKTEVIFGISELILREYAGPSQSDVNASHYPAFFTFLQYLNSPSALMPGGFAK